MGTSQSHSLKTTPQWSTAKKAMTSVIKNQGNRQKQSNLMTAFGRAIGDGFQFVSDVKSLGIGGAIDALGLAPNDKPQTPRELIKTLCGITAEGGDALHDDEAAVNAQDWLLSKIFEDCSSLGDVETILQQTDEDTIDAWIIDFEVEYIMEYMSELFQSHIFEKNANPEAVCNEIKQWLRTELNSRLADEMKHVNVFSREGKAYIDTLTARILDIWQ